MRMRQWTESDAATWLEQLTNFEIVGDEVRMKWDWIAPGWLYEPYKSHATRLIEYALRSTELQRAIEDMAGPRVHLSGLLWLIWEYVHLDTHTTEFDEERETIRTFLARIPRINTALQKLRMKVVELRNYANERDESIAVRFARDYEPPVSHFADSEVNRLSRVVDLLGELTDELEWSRCRLWKPMQPEMTAGQVQRFTLYFLFYVVDQMKGNRYWKRVTEIMNAVSYLQGHRADRYDAETIEEGYKAMRKDRENYQQSVKEWEILIWTKRKEMALALERFALNHP